MPIPLGIAPDSWGIWFPEDRKQTPWIRMLDEMQALGLEWIELGPYGYLPTSESVLRSALEQRGLKLCACLVEGNLEDPGNWPELERQLLGGGALAAALDAEFLILIDDVYTGMEPGVLTAPARLDDDDWKKLIDTTHRVAETARETFGLRTVFHPNADTHVEHEDQIERFMADTDPDLVGLCIDTGHIAWRDTDPVALFRRHHQRVPHIHLKSTSAEVMARVKLNNVPFMQAVPMGAFCEPAVGSVQFRALHEALISVNYKGLAIIEQDMYPVDFDKPLGIARRSRAYYESVGFGS